MHFPYLPLQCPKSAKKGCLLVQDSDTFTKIRLKRGENRSFWDISPRILSPFRKVCEVGLSLNWTQVHIGRLDRPLFMWLFVCSRTLKAKKRSIVRPCSERIRGKLLECTGKPEQITHIPGKRHLFPVHAYRIIVEKKGHTCAFAAKGILLVASRWEGAQERSI